MSDDSTIVPSDEVDEHQLELASQDGYVYRKAVEYMIEEVAHTGATTEEGEYFVGFAQGNAERMYRMDGDTLSWTDPTAEENCHLEIVVADAEDGRFLPQVPVRATIEGDTETVGPTRIPFVWHPGLYHYGRNLELPGDGTYTLTVEIEPPQYPRHDETNGDRYTETVEVTFEDIDIATGQS